MKFIPAKTTVYSEIGQQKHITFSFCNKTKEENEVVLTQMFHWVQCRDFLSDVLFAEETNEKVSKYNFTYDPSKKKIDRDKTRLLIKFKYDQDIENFLENIPVLNIIEISNGITKTKFKRVEKNIFLVEGSKMWQNTTFSLSLYTYLLKVLGYKFEDNWIEELKEYNTNEGNYAKLFIDSFSNILYNDLKKLFAKPTTVHGFKEDYAYVSYIHDNGGCLSLFKKGAENFVSLKNNEYYQRLIKLVHYKG